MNINIDYIKLRNKAFVFSLAIIIIGLFFIIFRGLNYGIDFTGGFRLLIKFNHSVNDEELQRIRDNFKENKLSETIRTYGENNTGIIIEMKGMKAIENITEVVEANKQKVTDISQIMPFLESYKYITKDDILERFTLTDEAGKLNIKTADQQAIFNEVRVIINQKLTDRIIESLNKVYSPDKNLEKRDINSSDKITIKNHLKTRIYNEGIKSIYKMAAEKKSFDEILNKVKALGFDENQFKEFFSDKEEKDKVILNIYNSSETTVLNVMKNNVKNIAIDKYVSQIDLSRANKNSFLSSWNIEGVPEEIITLLKKDFYIGEFIIESSEMVGPRVGKILREKAFLAIIWSLIFILIYISIRFEFKYALGAVAALFHDVCITVGIMCVFNKQFDITVIGALLTIIGYSLNDTIVVYDRIRENYNLKRNKLSFDKIINLSVTETLSRTIVTSLTTLLAVLALYIFSGDALNAFAFTFIIGIIFGTYSSIFIASPIVYLIDGLLNKKKRKR